MGCCRRLFCLSVFGFLFFALLAFLPGLPPVAEFSEFSVPSVQKLEGPLELNNVLDNAELLYENKIVGPEHLLEHKGELYSTLHGQIVKFVKGNIVHVTQIGKPCKGPHQDHICGRPLGMQFNKQGELIVADAYHGIWKVNVQTGQKTQLVSTEVEINGRRPRICNSLAVASTGDIYWTDSSSDVRLDNGLYTLLMNPSGRLIHYSASTKKNKVLLDGIWFANGVVLSPDESFLIVSETGAGRLIKHYLKGSRAGKSELFAGGLPGLPDNLTPLEDGILVPLVHTLDESHPLITHSLTEFPTIRKSLVRALTLVEIALDYAHQVLPNEFLEKAKYYWGHFTMTAIVAPKRVTVLHIGWDGRIHGSMHTTEGKITAICHALPYQGYLYLGSPFNTYLARVPMPKSLKIRQVKVEETQKIKPTEAPKPKPTEAPKPKPTEAPKPKPTEAPKPKPTETPKPKPTEAPKPKPTEAPKPKPTEAPKPKPTEAPKAKPTDAPKPKPTEAPKAKPTEAPKAKPTEAPKPKPTEAPKPKPTEAPKPKPTEAPKAKPTQSSKPKVTKEPAPIIENVKDVPPPQQEKLKVIKRGGEVGEL